MMNRKKPRPFARVVSAFCWTAAAGSLVLSLAWTMSWAAWEIDLVANLGAQWLLVMLALLALVLALRRWRAAAVVALACALQTWPLMTMRAAWLPLPAPGTRAGPDTVRVLHYNDGSRSDNQSIYELMDRSGADVIHILSPPIKMQNEVIYARGLEDKYPGKLIREFREVKDGAPSLIGAAFVVSRWRIRWHNTFLVGPMGEHLTAGIVERPGGEFAILAMHPRSPRDKARWIEGNAVVEAALAVIKDLESRGYPVVVMGDFNSTPSGYRSRWMSVDAGLRRCKPWLLAEGTHPDRVQFGLNKLSPKVIPGFWPASIAIDDVMVSRGIEVEAWTILPFLGGEHTPIQVDVRVPRSSNATSETNLESR